MFMQIMYSFQDVADDHRSFGLAPSPKIQTDLYTAGPRFSTPVVNHMVPLNVGSDREPFTVNGQENQPDGLSPREKEVLTWAARGKTSWETAQLLGLTEKTVKFYTRNACRRLNAQNKTHAVATCMQLGLIQI